MNQFQQFLTHVGDERASRMLGVPKRTIASWRRGERMPRLLEAVRIAETFYISLDEIFLTKKPRSYRGKANG